MGQSLGQFLPVYLDPLPLDEHQALLCRQQRPELALSQALVTQGDFEFEIQQRISTEFLLFNTADGDVNLRPGTLSPPVGQADNDATLLEKRRFLEECVGFGRCPCEWVVQISAIDQFPDQSTGLGYALHRGQQTDQELLVAGARIRLQGPGQGLMADLAVALAGEFRRIGRHKRERVVPIQPVFRQVKADTADLMPAWCVLFEDCTEAAMTADLRAHPVVEPAPDSIQSLRGEILGTAHRWCAFQ